MRPGFNPGAGAGNGLSIDREGYFSAMVQAAVGDVTSGTLVVKIQHSSDNTNWTDYQINSADVETDTLDTDNTHTNMIFDINGAERYIRAVATTTGTVSAFSVTFMLNDRQYGDEWNRPGQYTQNVLG